MDRLMFFIAKKKKEEKDKNWKVDKRYELSGNNNEEFWIAFLKPEYRT